MFKVKYLDQNIGENGIIESYLTEKDAEEAIEKDLEETKGFFEDGDYDYGDFGNITKIWSKNKSSITHIYQSFLFLLTLYQYLYPNRF